MNDRKIKRSVGITTIRSNSNACFCQNRRPLLGSNPALASRDREIKPPFKKHHHRAGDLTNPTFPSQEPKCSYLCPVLFVLWIFGTVPHGSLLVLAVPGCPCRVFWLAGIAYQPVCCLTFGSLLFGDLGGCHHCLVLLCIIG